MKSNLLGHNELLAQEPDLKRLQDAYALLSTDTPRALMELEDLAKSGSVTSMGYLGKTYKDGSYADPVKAERWLIAAYERGSLNAALSLGGIYYRQGSFDLAEKMFTDGALNGNGAAMYWLARIYMRGRVTEEKYSKIKDLLEDATAQGQIRAKNSLAFLLMKGRYGIKNVPRGVYLYFSSLIDAFKVGVRNPDDPRLW